MKRRGLLSLLTVRSAPYEVPTDNLARPLERVKPERDNDRYR